MGINVTLWDLDYYYREDKTNWFNDTIQKLSSYHKQRGDVVNFVNTQDDLNRPADLIYIFKEEVETPNPPLRFFHDKRVRWGGEIYKQKKNWKISNLECVRSDYLLYPNLDTKIERAEHLRLVTDEGQLITLMQDYKNSFKNKYVIEVDKGLWDQVDEKTTLAALQKIVDLNAKRLVFHYPITLKRLRAKEVLSTFCKIHFAAGDNFKWQPVYLQEAAAALDILAAIKSRVSSAVSLGTITLYFDTRACEHYKNKDKAKKDLYLIISIILKAKSLKIKVKIEYSKDIRYQTPYYFLFETLCDWTAQNIRANWLNFITMRYNNNEDISGLPSKINYWRHPEMWHPLFRHLLAQTWTFNQLMTTFWGDSQKFTIDNLPYNIWENTFKEGLD